MLSLQLSAPLLPYDVIGISTFATKP